MADGDAHPKFDVSLVTPDGPVFQGEAEMLIVPGAAGRDRRARPPRAARRDAEGRLDRVHLGGNEVVEFATGPGFFKVETDTALALVDDAVNVKEIDDARAQAQLDAAKAELEKLERGRVDGRPLAARAAHPARREPARGLRSHDRLTLRQRGRRLRLRGRSSARA